jgi:hypothetical protein
MAERINGLCYDIEIVNAVPDKKRKPEPGIKYCSGWDDHKGMGVACVCVYDMWTREVRVFTKGNFEDMMELFSQREEIVSYYGTKFDDKVLKAAGFNIKTTYDVCLLLRARTGEPDKWERGVSRGGMGLGEVAQANGFGAKREDGWKAPIMWQMGQYGRVIDYCIDDAMKTYKLFMKRHAIYVESYKKTYALREPKSFERARERKREEERLAYLARRSTSRSEVYDAESYARPDFEEPVQEYVDGEFTDNVPAPELPPAPARALPARPLSVNEEARLEAEQDLLNEMLAMDTTDYEIDEDFIAEVTPKPAQPTLLDIPQELGKIPW